MSLSDETLVKT